MKEETEKLEAFITNSYANAFMKFPDSHAGKEFIRSDKP